MPEIRKDPETHQWVIIAAERSKRPSDYQVQPGDEDKGKRVCPFCPGNENQTPPEIKSYPQTGTRLESKHWAVRVVPNKFPVVERGGESADKKNGIYESINRDGDHEIIIETPHHAQTLAQLNKRQFQDVLSVYGQRIRALKHEAHFRYALLFKNQGNAAGASLSHSHSQLVALSFVPQPVAETIKRAEEYHDRHKRCLYCEIISQEIKSGVRLVSENELFVTVVPYAARSPLETRIYPKKHNPSFEDSLESENKQLAQAFRTILRKYEVGGVSPSFNFLVRTFPFNNKQYGDNSYYHWHIEIIPRVTNLAGFEWGSGMYVNPILPEDSAAFLREIQPEPGV